MSDVRYAFRLLLRNPVLSVVTIVVLGGGLGVSIFTYSFLHTVMLRPLPFENGEEIVRIVTFRSGDPGYVEAAHLTAIRPAITTVTDLGTYRDRQVVMQGEHGSRVVSATFADWNVFTITRTAPLLGRVFYPEDQEPGAEPVIVLGHALWQGAFAADSAVIGTLVDINAAKTRVIGVMPKQFGFPVSDDAWLPLPHSLHEDVRDGLMIGAYARLRTGVSIGDADAEFGSLGEHRADEWNTAEQDRETAPERLGVTTFQLAQMGPDGPLVFAMLNILAALILVLACINVGNLLLARASERSRETAIRSALGASRTRLILQSLWETLAISVMGALLATLLASWGLRAVDGWAQTYLADNLAYWWVWEPNRYTLGAAGVFVLVAVAIVGSVVSFRTTRTRLTALLRENVGAGRSRRTGRLSSGIVVVQVVAVSVLMFFGALSSIVAYGFTHLDLGIETADRLLAAVSLDTTRYDTIEKRQLFAQRMLDGLDRGNGIEATMLRASLSEGRDDLSRYASRATVPSSGAEYPRARILAIGGVLTAQGISLLAGRPFDDRDTDGATPAALVSESVARAAWPGSSPVGEQVLLVGIGEDREWRTVVGVVGDIVSRTPLSSQETPEAVYIPLRQSDARAVTIVVHHSGRAEVALGTIQRTLGAVDPLTVPDRIVRYEEILNQSAILARSVTKLFIGCLVFALILATAGIYALAARSVTLRAREIGIRRALGASDGRVVRMLLVQSGWRLCLGAVLALPLTLVVGAAFSTVFPIDAVLYGASGVGVAVLVTLVMGYATYVPARRAIRVEPRVSLWDG